MFSFLKLFVSFGAVGATVAIPTTFALKNQIISPKAEIQEREEKLEQGNTVDSQEPKDSGHSVDLSEEQKKDGEKEEEVKLCKEVVRSDEHMGRLMVCRTGKDNSEVKFNYIADLVVDTVPHEVINIKFTHNSLIAELKEQLDYSSTRLFSSIEEILTGKGIIRLNKVAERINTKDCKLEWLNEGKKDWIVKCEVN